MSDAIRILLQVITDDSVKILQKKKIDPKSFYPKSHELLGDHSKFK